MGTYKNIKNTVNSLTGYISQYSRTFGDAVGNRFRMRGRIRLANRWARHHPKRFFVYFLVIMASLITINETIYFLMKKNREEKTSSAILAVLPMFDGRHRIDANREGLKIQFSQLIEEGNQLLIRLDSLYNKPVKTASDSLEIYHVIKKIETISNILDNETEFETD